MSADENDVAVDAPDGFSVRDANSANWLVRKINDARAYARHVEQWAAAELRRAQREEQFLLHRYGHQLENWAQSQINQRHDGRKSVFLPAGCIGFRTAPASLMVQDEETLLSWCKKNLADAVKTQETVLRGVVLDHLRATGEVADGAEVCGGDERFFVREQKINEGIDAADAE